MKPRRKDVIYYGGLSLAVGIAAFAIIYGQQIQSQNSIYVARPLSIDDIKQYGNTDQSAVIVYPIFTQNAYKDGGFYDYFKGICNTCNSVSLDPKVNATYVTGISGFEYLRHLNYSYITDIDVDRNPDILKQYDKIILLHNEYMTKAEFEAIRNHSHVIYLYPNSAYVQISVNYSTMKQSLVKGHGYDSTETPPYPIKTGDASNNGFGYVTSSQYEYDFNCNNWRWEARPNGIQPTCWPEFLIKSDRSVLQTIKDYPKVSPVIPANITKSSINIPYCDSSGKCVDQMPEGYYRIPIITKLSFVPLNKTQTNQMINAMEKYSTLGETANALNEDKKSLILNLWRSTAYDFDSHCSTLSTDGSLSLLLKCSLKDSVFLFKPYPIPVFVFIDKEFLKSSCDLLDNSYYCYVNSTKIVLSKESL